jgi:hypothetical protein
MFVLKLQWYPFRIVELQSRALLFLSNLINTGDISRLGGPSLINELWSHLTSLTADPHIQGTAQSLLVWQFMTILTLFSPVENLDQLECVTCALRALAQKMTSLQPALVIVEFCYSSFCHPMALCFLFRFKRLQRMISSFYANLLSSALILQFEPMLSGFWLPLELQWQIVISSWIHCSRYAPQ